MCRQEREVCTNVNTYTRISEECPLAIHSVELRLKGMAAVGVSPISVAQMLGHSSTQTVPRYAQVLDQNRLGAMRKLEVGNRTSPELPQPRNL
jgi:hypothetical protein